MSTLADRNGAALLVIDVQRDVFASAHDRDGVVQRIVGLVERARHVGAPVIWVQHSDEGLTYGSDGWRIVDELEPAAGEAIVEKVWRDSFEDTNLEDVLAQAKTSEIVVVGGQTDFCVRSTLHGGIVRGYDMTLVGDAHTTEDLREWLPEVPDPASVIAHTNAYWAGQHAPGRTSRVIVASDVTFDARETPESAVEPSESHRI